MFDDLRNQSDQKNKPPLGPQPPIAPKEDISQRIKGLEEQGSKQGKRKTIYSVIGIAVILLFAGGIITAGYYSWPEITVGFNEFIGKSAEQTEINNSANNNENQPNETAENIEDSTEDSDELLIINEEWKNCGEDSDCVETQADCCECNNGGAQAAINDRYLEEWKNAIKTKCQDMACATVYNCKDGKAVCENSQCVFKEDTETVAASSTEENVNLDTSDWQTYRNEEYGLQFQYPVETGGGTTEIIENKNIIYLVPKNNLHYQEIQENIKSDKSDFEKVSGISWAFLIKQVNNEEELLNVIKLRYGLGCNIEKIMSKNQVDVYDIIIKKDGKTPEEGSQCFINYKVITKYYFDENKVVLWSMGQDCTFFIQNEDGSECYDDEIADTFKFLKDTDNDGLFDDEEPQYGTDLNNPDSDGDGYLDGDEVKNGYNPIGEGKIDEGIGQNDTSDWWTYRNEEYGVALKYPEGWYWEDYTSKVNIKEPEIGFYPNNKKKGYEYMGDIVLSKRKKDAKENIEQYFQKVYKDMPYLFEKIIKDKTDKGRDVVFVYSVPGNVDKNIALINCGDSATMLSTPFIEKREILKSVAKSVECLD